LEKKSKINFKNWQFKDIILDTLPGVSLNRSYDSLLINKKGKQVIVAVIDMAVEINHHGLVNHIWKNSNEVIGNEIDDDKNGYIDDINGWNFLSNSKGENNEFVNYEYTRILRKFNHLFQYKTIVDISSKDSLNFIIYKKAKKDYDERMNYAIEDIDYINMVSKGKSEAERKIMTYLPIKNYTVKDLDSLKKSYPKDIVLQKMIRRKSNFIKYGYTDKYINDYKLKADNRIDKLLNLKYNDRLIQGDNSYDLKDIGYGSNSFNVNTTILNHGTKMAGIIVNIGLENEIKIMPLAISAYGDEHDKDIALAIKYAVDNGAKVINMSFAKEFSLQPLWTIEAIKYAEKNNVLIIHSSSNDDLNLDSSDSFLFPNDHNYFEIKEESDNFLRVGSSSMSVNKIKSSFSNYGKTEVDLFAPGEKIYTTFSQNKFDISSGGTSSASAITSGVAALIFSYYPNLTASQVKHILMDSGLEYDIEVSTPSKDDKNKMTPFNQLSKSGKVLNAYNAFIMADSISRSN
jgi:subtilisin family serine protease